MIIGSNLYHRLNDREIEKQTLEQEDKALGEELPELAFLAELATKVPGISLLRTEVYTDEIRQSIFILAALYYACVIYLNLLCCHYSTFS